MRSRNALLGLTLLLAGCATRALDQAPDRPDRPWTPATSTTGEIVPGPASAASPARDYVLPTNQSIAIPTPPQLDPAHPYTLAELIDIAERTSPATRIAWNQARDAALAAGIAQSLFLPRIAISAIGAYRTDTGRSSTDDVGRSSGSSLGGTTTAISLDWLLFDFGKRQATVDAARQLAIASDIGFTAAHQRLIHAVSVAFYVHAATEERVKAAVDGLANARVILSASQDRLAHGQGTIVEVAQARQLVAQAELKLVQANGQAQDSRIDLLVAIGISPLSRLAIADISGRPLPDEATDQLERVIAESVGRRPDVLSAFAGEKARQAEVRAAQADFKPKLFLSATGSYTSSHLDLSAIPGSAEDGPTLNLSGHHVGATVLAGVRMPLFDGGTRSAVLAQARDHADSAAATYDQVRDQAVREIVTADNDLHTALAAHKAAGALLDAAQTSYDAALGAYRHGVGSITEVATAQSQLVEARSAVSDAYSTALSAAASLALATGALGSAPS